MHRFLTAIFTLALLGGAIASATPTPTPAPVVNSSLNVPINGTITDPNAPPTPTFVLQDGTGKYVYTADPPVSYSVTTTIQTVTPLGAGGVFTSSWIDTNATGTKTVDFELRADQAGTFQVQSSDDLTNANFTRNLACLPYTALTCSAGTLTLTANATSTTGSFYVPQRYWRIVYTNGATPQTSFEITSTTTANDASVLVRNNDTNPAIFRFPVGYSLALNFGTSPLYSNLYQIGGTQVDASYFQPLPGQFGIAKPTNVTYTAAILHCIYPTASPSPNPQPSPGNVTFVPCDSAGRIAVSTPAPLPTDAAGRVSVTTPSPLPTDAAGRVSVTTPAPAPTDATLRVAVNAWQDGPTAIADSGNITSATTTALLAHNASKQLYIFSLSAQASAAETTSFWNVIAGTGVLCGTGTITLFPTALNLPGTSGSSTTGYGGSLVANNAAGISPALAPFLWVPPGDDVCITSSGTTIAFHALLAYTWH